MFTTYQQDFVTHLKCVRLRDVSIDPTQLSSFQSKWNDNLTEYLKNSAQQDDHEGQTAVYLVVDERSGNIAAFFSIHCGSLFEDCDLIISEITTKLKNSISEFEDAYALSSDCRKNVTALSPILLGKREKAKAFLKELKDEELKQKFIAIRKLNKIRSDLRTDCETEANRKNINRVAYTVPALELVHFCVDDGANDKWKQNAGPQGNRHKLGAHIFWNHILPIVENVCAFVGCKCVFLFAADSSSDGALVNYYKDVIGFSDLERLGVSKPRYDWTCKFLSAEIQTLRDKRTAYFQSLADAEEDLV